MEDLYEVQPDREEGRDIRPTTRMTTRTVKLMKPVRAPDLLDHGVVRAGEPIGEYKPAGTRPRRRREWTPKAAEVLKGQLHLSLGRPRSREERELLHAAGAHPVPGEVRARGVARGKTADDILQFTVCEPAMGSAAFLNEAVNQLAEAYFNLIF